MGGDVDVMSDTFLGLDLGGSSAKAAVVRGEVPRVVGTARRAIPGSRRPDEVVAVLAGLAEELSAEHGPPTRLGLGLPGLHDEATGRSTLLPNFPPEWVGFPIRDVLAERVGTAPVLVNDARAFSLAEAVLGSAAGLQAVVCVTLGTGVGGGVVLGGRLWHGQGTAGEIGHQTVEIDGPRCGCGNVGCVEAIASSAALVAAGGRATPREVFEAAYAGDERAAAAVARAVEAVGTGLANAYALLAPDAFVVGGGVAEAGDRLLTALAEVIRRRVRVAPPTAIRVLPATIGRNAGAVGAALYARG